MSEFPGIEGKDPVEVWCFVENLRWLMRKALGKRRFSSGFSKYLNEIHYDNDDDLYHAGFQTSIAWYPVYDFIRYREDVGSLETLLTWLRVAATIDEFAVFCELLAQPENRIKGRYVNTRTEADMVNEMARVLTDLQDHTAYAKVLRAQTGKGITWKGKIRTIKLA